MQVEMTARKPSRSRPRCCWVSEERSGASLEAQDAYGNRVLTYEGSRTIKVTYELKGTGAPPQAMRSIRRSGCCRFRKDGPAP